MKKEKKRYNLSFASRLTRWVMLVLLIMMCGMSFLIYEFAESSIVEVSAISFHNSMLSSDRYISDVTSNVGVAVKNNIFDIERNLSRPDEMQAIVERIVTQNPRIRSCGISFIENYYPNKGRWFCPYAWRNDSLQVIAQQLGGEGYDYLKTGWFKESIACDSAYWSKPFFDGQDSKTPLVAYMHPIHDSKGRIVAILGADLSLDFLTRVIEEQDSIFTKESWVIKPSKATFRSYVLSPDGTYITHPDHRRIQKGNFFVHIKDLDEPGMAETAIKEIKERKSSTEETYKVLMVNRKDTYLFYSPITGTDWMLAIAVPTTSIDFFGMLVGVVMLTVIIFVLAVTFLVCFITIKRATKPLKHLASTADMVAQGQFDTPLPDIKHHDEICQLRDSFENMQHSLTNYVEELKTTTTAKASIENELKIAHGIQMSMLPKTYPAFPNRNDIDIYGQVTPAKAVGGDLYDFFIRDEKLFFCIGDVSGKGVPASLVMAVTRSLFRNIAAHSAEPEKLIKDLNESLSENNETSMFVTLFVGVLDLKTGFLKYSNAGHDMPLLIKGNTVDIMECEPNIPVGVMPDWNFTCQEAQLDTDTTIFLYTDGLNEAENTDHQQFGLDRMVNMAKKAGRNPQELITAMSSAVQVFVGDAEQSDDLTMFAIQKK